MQLAAAWFDASGSKPAQIVDLEVIFANIVQVLLATAGVVLFILLLTGGIRFITSGGDPKAAEGAQKTITSAIIGLVAVLLAYIILLIIGTVTGVDLTLFKITI